MQIVVCIKQVPDTTEVTIDPKTGTLNRTGVPSIINPEDKNAIETGLGLREEHGGEVAVISMGPPQAHVALREAMGMGADRAILLTDRAFAGADTWATATTLGSAIKVLGSVDIILCGRQAIDGDTAQVGPQLAEFLKIPQVTYVRSLEIKDGKLKAKRGLEDGYEVVEVKLPALLTVAKEANLPRYPTAWALMDAYKEKQVEEWGIDKLGIDVEHTGMKGSPTRVMRTFTPQPMARGEMISGPPREAARSLVIKLRAKNIIP